MATTYHSQFLTNMQVELLVAELEQRGKLALAGAVIGVDTRTLRSFMARDEQLNALVEDALERHSAHIYVTALERATTGRSDVLLSKMLDAKVPEFNKEAQKTEALRKGKPTGLALRDFTLSDSGEVEEANVVTPEPEKPAKPLQIGFRIF